MDPTTAELDRLEGWLYELEGPSAEEIRRQYGGRETDAARLELEQWRHLTRAIGLLGPLAARLVDPASRVAQAHQSGTRPGAGVTAELVAAVSKTPTAEEALDRAAVIRAAMGSLAIAGGIQLQLDTRAERNRRGTIH